MLRLTNGAIVGITDITEAMHHRVLYPPYLPSTPFQHIVAGISGFVYSNIKCTSRLTAYILDKLLSQYPAGGEAELSEEGEIWLGILNGVLGDHLENTANPLAIPMQFRHRGQRLSFDEDAIRSAYSQVNGRLLLMVHGLCMNDVLWNHDGHDHGRELALELGMTPVYLHYNGGRHISANGRQFSELLEQLIASWPVPVEEMTIVAHSMGGLVSRSAFYYGALADKQWAKYLKKIVFLGSPHHGSSLEQIGNYIDYLLSTISYTKPFARLGMIRSAGITDLRYGNLLDEDWQGAGRFEKRPDQRKHLPLPEQVTCYNLVACSAGEESHRSLQLLGDRMVPLNSALGVHRSPERCLQFEEGHVKIMYDCSHIGLLRHQKIYDQILRWLA